MSGRWANIYVEMYTLDWIEPILNTRSQNVND